MKKLGLWIAWVALVALAVACSGCRFVKYENPNGTTVSYLNVGFDTSIGRLSVPTANGVAELEGVASKQSVTADLADTAREAIRRVPVPTASSPTEGDLYRPAPPTAEPDG